MMTTWGFTKGAAEIVSFLGLYFAFFLLSKVLKDFWGAYKMNDQLRKEGNLAVALTLSGYYLAVTAIFVGALIGPSQGLIPDLMSVSIYSLLGIVFLNLSRWFNDKMILRKFCNTRQLVEERNMGVGAVQFGSYLATGLIMAGSISGQGGGILSALVFFILGQLSLLLFSLIYEWCLPYNIHVELKKKNTASGIAFGGTLIALSIIVMGAVSGDFGSWSTSLKGFFSLNALTFIFLPIVRAVMDRLIVPGGSLSRKIQQEQNLGAGVLEATIAIGFSIVLNRLV